MFANRLGVLGAGVVVAALAIALPAFLLSLTAPTPASAQDNSGSCNSAPPNTTPPSAPAFTAATPASTSVVLAWNPSAQQYGVLVTDYIVFIWDSNDALVKQQTFIASDDALATYTETVSGLTASTMYTATVRARNIVGCLSAYGERSFTTTVGGL